jgi:hypothetical protein
MTPIPGDRGSNPHLAATQKRIREAVIKAKVTDVGGDFVNWPGAR